MGDERVTIRVYDLMGRVIRTLHAGERFAAGTHTATWDGRDAGNRQVASGTYFYSVEVDGQRLTRPMLLVK